MPRHHNYDVQDGEDVHLVPTNLIPGKSGSKQQNVIYNKDGTLCRTCTDFKTWMKLKREKVGQGQKTLTANSVTEEELETVDRNRRQCPVDKDELGRATWSFLHTLSVNLPENPSSQQKSDLKQFMNLFSKFYPCEPCAQDLRQDITQHPVDVSSGTAFARWLCGAHNRVNRKLGKEEFDCDKVFERWRDGWKNGSCDY